MFGGGTDTKDADMVPVKEDIIVWTNTIGSILAKQILLPASSIKGALSHRIAYYYNALTKRQTECITGCFIRKENLSLSDAKNIVQDFLPAVGWASFISTNIRIDFDTVLFPDDILLEAVLCKQNRYGKIKHSENSLYSYYEFTLGSSGEEFLSTTDKVLS